jgi:hypothetical protein
MCVTINMCILKTKIKALTLVGVMTKDECNILHVAPEDESLKSKHVIQYTLCPISYAGEQKNIVLTLSLFISQSFNIPTYSCVQSVTFAKCQAPSTMFLSELSISTVLKQL